MDDAIRDGAKAFFGALEKLRQARSMFDAEHENIRRLREELTAAWQQMCGGAEDVEVRVSAFAFFLGDDPVYTNEEPEESIAYRFHRDGVRAFTFSSGIGDDELDWFEKLCTLPQSDPMFAGHDTVSLLWERELEHVRYVAIESFSGFSESDEVTDERKAVASEIRMVENLEAFVSSFVDKDPGAAAGDIRVSQEDLKLLEDGGDLLEDLATDDVPDQQEDAELAAPARQRLTEAMAAEKRELDQRFMRALVEQMLDVSDQALFDLLASQAQSRIRAQCGRGAFEAAAASLALVADLDNPHLKASLADALQDGLVDRDLLKILGRAAGRKERELATRLGKFLQHLDTANLLVVFRAFRKLKDDWARTNWLGWMARHPALDNDAGRAALIELEPDVATAVIDALARKPTIHAVRAIGAFADHPAPELRARMLNATAKSNLPEIKYARRRLLLDADQRVAARAMRYVQQTRDRAAANPLRERLADAAFLAGSLDEVIPYVTAYCGIVQDQALPLIEAWLGQKSVLLKRSSAEHYHRLAVAGLGVIRSGDAARRLSEIAEGRYGKEVRAEAQRALERLKAAAQRRQQEAAR